ncbi:MAG: nicotinate (nicotinamide) nucleotide adenylyltransferase [Chitinivibrionales bacterium]|nr:nicotinate (nicotinamide) nucleotide adenylyltransferase [Chitinivibrionales bacterium]MBD3395683.1 nicotinate (nicotinamide) nucleotide adenylyltransferase [Chitinivibrionales bacterium]
MPHRTCSGSLSMAFRRKAPIGVLGGSFDPVHFGHLAIARLALEHFDLHKMLFIPAGVPPHKPDTVCAAAGQRLAMLKLAISGQPGFAAWDIEIRRPGKSYTVDTLTAVKKRFPGRDTYFIIGSDNLPEITTWHRYKALLSMTTLCIAHRPGHSMRVPRAIRGARILRFPSPEWGISSSRIRKLLAEGHSCRYLVPDSALRYAAARNLYH